MSNIAIVGSISMDLVMQTNRIPQEGETVVGDSFSMVPGGKGANQAVAIGRLSNKSDQITMLGAVGKDSFGPLLQANLTANHVCTQHVGTLPAPSGVAQITLYQSDNRIIYYPGANGLVDPNQWRDEWQVITAAELVVLQNEIPHHANLQIAHFCQKHQIPVLYNPAPARETDLEMLDLVTYFTPNQHECQELFPDKNLSEALLTYPEKLIVTLGSKGLTYASKNQVQHIPAIKAQAIDTTGAGDTFNGALGYAIAQGLELTQALRFATLAAHLSVQKFGAQGGMPSLEEMKEHPAYEKAWHFE
ncbi:ribokinase [Streptococcus halichoeri]|uniref:ribokinase n=1 Tax=Streptococcus halichoeri TaxID=254785 RepID=UPI00135B4B4A|nr:ribokinase [Streptococcus halichoeri]